MRRDKLASKELMAPGYYHSSSIIYILIKCDKWMKKFKIFYHLIVLCFSHSLLMENYKQETD